MSVVVRMRMPQHCGECNLYVGGWCYVLTPDSPQEKEWYASHKERPPMCPIICQLPEEHGRLVDADAFEKDVSDALVYGLKEIPGEEGKQIFHVMMQEVLDNVKKRETIVPAERSEA